MTGQLMLAATTLDVSVALAMSLLATTTDVVDAMAYDAGVAGVVTTYPVFGGVMSVKVMPGISSA
jgi:hypothetical protein